MTEKLLSARIGHGIPAAERGPLPRAGDHIQSIGSLTPGLDHVAVLTDGGQEAGLGALINSLIRNGFDGIVWVGWRGTKPALLTNLPRPVVEQVAIKLVEVDTKRPLAYHKPDFLDLVWDLAPAKTKSVSYMDCDIVLGCEWAFIRAWVHGGLAVVEDLPHRPVGANHPLRRAWQALMTAAGIAPVRDVDTYYNSGFVGVPATCRPLLPAWSALCQTLEGLPGVRKPDQESHFIRGERTEQRALNVPDDLIAVMRQFFLEDQDAFNMAVMATTVPMCPMGPDAMGFTAARTPILLHAVGPDKPWTVPYLWRLVRHGEGPTFADDGWWWYSDGPIPVARGASYTRRRWSWRLAKLLKRIL